MDIGGGSGGSPRKLVKILKKISRKINEPENFENFPEFLANVDLKLICNFNGSLKNFNNSKRN